MAELGMGTPVMHNLSICIPTYKRYDFLKWTLGRTARDFPDSHIIVSDNCSNDGTENIKGIRYIRQPSNIGAFPNMRAALLAANTKYCVFVADDDYLVAEEVRKGVEFLEANPGINCYFAPCQLYDEVADKPAWDAFYVSEDKTYNRPDELWNFVMQKHVWPEHAIYRRKGLEEILQPRIRPYWCFVDLANAFDKGPVHFASTPYYRNLTNHPIGWRQKMGDQQCLTDFDEYRSGLELLAFGLFKQHLSVGVKMSINDGIRQFLYLRYDVARKILLAQNRTDEADILHKRMHITGY